MDCVPFTIVIGAGRSGTNMLRNVLCRFPGFGTWPCDEINPIWRHGNLRYHSDEFTREMARPEVQRYIRGCFDNIRRRYRLRTVVEKTCANSLRVGFVDRVLPEAKLIFIRRNGLDAAASALKRWTSKMDFGYQFRKARFEPLGDLPHYAFRFVRSRVYRLYSKDRRLSSWGPQLNGMQELLTRYSLEEVCALQWKGCVDRAIEDFSLISPGRVVEVGYEDFVTSPEIELKRILDFLGYRVEIGTVSKAVADVSAASIGKGMDSLGEEGAQRILPHIYDTQKKLGYV